MCGGSLLNTDDTDVSHHRDTDVTVTASVAVILVLLLLTFQCSVTKWETADCMIPKDSTVWSQLFFSSENFAS